MRNVILLLVLLLSACDALSVEGLLPGEDAQQAIQDLGWLVVASPMVGQEGLTECATKTVFIARSLPPLMRAETLAHEYVHVVQAETKGCVRFWAGIRKHEVEAYLASWQYIECLPEAAEHYAAQLARYGWDGVVLPTCDSHEG